MSNYNNSLLGYCGRLKIAEIAIQSIILYHCVIFKILTFAVVNIVVTTSKYFLFIYLGVLPTYARCLTLGSPKG